MVSVLLRSLAVLRISALLLVEFFQVHAAVELRDLITSREPGERWEVVTFALPPQLRRYVVLKGSVALDGVSLTVSDRTDDTFSVSLIPTTLELTTLGARRPGDEVNVEVDVLAKYVESMLADGRVDQEVTS